MFCSLERTYFFLLKADWFDLITDWAESSRGYSFGLRHSSARIWTKGLSVYQRFPASTPLSSQQLNYCGPSTIKLLRTLFYQRVFAYLFILLFHALFGKHLERKTCIWGLSNLSKGQIFLSLVPQDPQSPAGPHLHSPLTRQSLNLQPYSVLR